jgi:hypothetical protein
LQALNLKKLFPTQAKISNLDKGNQEIPHFAGGLLTSLRNPKKSIA